MTKQITLHTRNPNEWKRKPSRDENSSVSGSGSENEVWQVFPLMV